MTVKQVGLKTFGIDHSQNGVEPGQIPQFGAEEGKGDGQGVGNAGGFDHQVVNAIAFIQHPVHRLHQVVVNGAADTAVGQLHHVLLDGDQKLAVDIDIAKFIHQHGNAKGVEVLQNVVQQSGFAAA